MKILCYPPTHDKLLDKASQPPVISNDCVGSCQQVLWQYKLMSPGSTLQDAAKALKQGRMSSLLITTVPFLLRMDLGVDDFQAKIHAFSQRFIMLAEVS